MNKFVWAVPVVLVVASGCASVAGPAWPGGMQAGKFSRMTCDAGKTFAVRPAEDGKSVRVRSLHGAAELERKADGQFAGEGYELMLGGAQGASLTHNGKAEAQNCKVQA